jgi:hypothetical protein
MTEQEAEVAGIVERFLAAVASDDRDGIRAHHADDVLMYDLPFVSWVTRWVKTLRNKSAFRSILLSLPPKH